MSGAYALAAGSVACLFSVTAAVPLKHLALRWGFTDRPGGHKRHLRPTPYLGGIAITLATVLPAMAALGFADQRITAILLAATAVALLGLIDDIASLPALTRLTVETVSAIGVVLAGVEITVTGAWPDGVITVIWIVVLTNSFNLLDNMDGSLGAVATVSAAFLAGAAFLLDQPALALLLIVLAGAALGFLPHNWSPARMFMGDAGSLFIGFVLTCSAVALSTGRGPGTAVAGLLLTTFVATVDTGVVFLSRLRAGRSPLTGGTDHVSHRLRRLGFDARSVALLLALTAAFAGALLAAMVLGWVPALSAAIVAAGTAIGLITLLLSVNADVPHRPVENPPRIRERRR
ncbi:MraY family glycosyltransferase [Nonomuraea cavernae]|uniref:Glycosyltransferase n=1 Tax=Nonomuraea cavernae TaxID=2045107 RepID=A0A917YTH0_9ACTN|nr:MraY family glycosyltransferase [Nonomuraea cavernae]MCA2185163.1 undecaprenyl/decaprenyl-phosphate alpha-N-acetylglucosaminyl 1-phosphate transferase [Nonomuraea cavernae]GGO65602.1 putative glycosyltransferase [Nonomuraea cavernae]